MGRPPKPKEQAILQPVGQEVLPPEPVGNVTVEASKFRQVPRYEFAPIKTLGDGASPGDVLLEEMRFWLGLVGKERAKRRPNQARLVGLWEHAREAAKAAAPYCHTKLAAMKFTADVTTTNNWNVNLLMAAVSKLPDQEIEAFERIFRLIAATGDAAGASGGAAAPGPAGPGGTAPPA